VGTASASAPQAAAAATAAAAKPVAAAFTSSKFAQDSVNAHVTSDMQPANQGMHSKKKHAYHNPGSNPSPPAYEEPEDDYFHKSASPHKDDVSIKQIDSPEVTDESQEKKSEEEPKKPVVKKKKIIKKVCGCAGL
jgi:hypothetical protein